MHRSSFLILLADEKEMSFEDLETFLTEGTLMLDFKHGNVLSLVGVVSEEGERPLVVLPYMENGDLCTFLKRDEIVGDFLSRNLNTFCLTVKCVSHVFCHYIYVVFRNTSIHFLTHECAAHMFIFKSEIFQNTWQWMLISWVAVHCFNHFAT